MSQNAAYILIAATSALISQGVAAQRVVELRLPAPNATLETEFTRVAAVRALADGRVLLTDAGENKLFVADFTRQRVTQIGRNGQGPNEYTSVASLFPLANDSTLLPDARGGRWLLLHGASIVGMVPPDSPPIRAGARNPLAADTTNHVLWTRNIRSLEGIGTTTTGAADSMLILRIARSTGDVDTLGKARARPSRIVVTGRDRVEAVSVITNPLAVGEQTLLFPDGWVAVARFDPYRVDWITPQGRTVRGGALPERRVAVDDRVKRWVLEEIAERSGMPPANPDAMPSDWPEVIPAFLTNALLAAPNGDLWLRRAATEPRSPARYDVIDRQGMLTAQVVVAANERVVGFGTGAVYSTTTDADGIQRVRRHAMQLLK